MKTLHKDDDNLRWRNVYSTFENDKSGAHKTRQHFKAPTV